MATEKLKIGVIPKRPIETPLLFYKVGLPGSAPAGAVKTLAREFGAKYHSSLKARQDIYTSGEATGEEKPANVRSSYIKRALFALAWENLRNKEDVMLDAAYNTAKTRRGPAEIAARAGGLTVALYFQTAPQVAQDRLRDSQIRKYGKVDTSAPHRAPGAMIKSARRSMEAPLPHQSEIDHLFRFDGTTSVESIVEQFAVQLYQAGLADRYQRPMKLTRNGKT